MIAQHVSDKNEIVTIYIPLLNEGIEVSRPTKALILDFNRYKVFGINGGTPENEEWKFSPGSIVECLLKNVNKQNVLIAYKSVEL